MVIYKATFPNGKVYIGKTKNFELRKYHHIWDSKKLKNSRIKMHKAINKYGYDNIKWDILCECSSLDELNKKEVEFIKLYNSISHDNGYNMVCGDKENYTKRENFDVDYQIDIIKRKLKSNGHNPDQYIPFTEELIDNIKNDYLINLFSIKKLVKKYKISEQRITRLLLSEKIVIDTDRCILTNSKVFDIDYINLIISDYKNGLKIKDIAKKEYKSIMIISRILHDSGVRISNRFKNGKRYDGKQPKNKINGNGK